MLTDILASILGIGLLFLLLNRATINLRYKTRGFINLIVGFILILIFGISFVYEYENDELLNYYRHYLFVGSSFIYSIYFVIHFFNIRDQFDKKKVILSKTYYQEFIFLMYRYKTDIFLVKEKENFKGYIIKLKKTDFHDEFIRKYNSKHKLVMENDEIIKQGKVTLSQKKQIYHCYKIDLKNDCEIKGLTRVNGFKLIYYDVDDFNKQIIARLMLRDKFDITL